MRSSLVLVVALLVAGCAAPGPAPRAATPLCAAPCEMAVDTGPDRAFEPHAALHPSEPRRAIVVSSVFIDDAEMGYNDKFRVHVTDDRGATWSTWPFEELLAPTDPVRHYTNWGDPWLVWLADGTLLLFGMGATGSVREAPFFGWTSFDIFVVRSVDGGRSWTDGQVLARGQGAVTLAAQTNYYDQPHVVVGPDGRLLAGWLISNTGPDGSTRGDILATQSTDGGRTWGASVTVEEGVFHNPRPAIAPDGTMFMAYRDYGQDGPVRPVKLSRSVDGGATWTPVDLAGLTSISRPSVVANERGAHLLVAEPVEAAMPRVTLVTVADGNITRQVLAEMQGEGEPLVTLVGDAHGGLWATYHVVQEDGTNTLHAWHRAPDGAERTQRLDRAAIGPNDPQGLIGWPSLGDYMGLAASRDGAIAAWVSGTHGGQDVRAAWLT